MFQYKKWNKLKQQCWFIFGRFCCTLKVRWMEGALENRHSCSTCKNGQSRAPIRWIRKVAIKMALRKSIVYKENKTLLLDGNYEAAFLFMSVFSIQKTVDRLITLWHINANNWVRSPLCCLRLKAKDLGITRVIVVGFFVSKTHATSLSLCILIFSIFFFYCIYHSIMYDYQPTNVSIPMYTYLSLPTHILHTYANLPTYVYLPTSTYLPIYINRPTYVNLPSCTFQYQHMYQPMSTYHHLTTYIKIPTYVYLPTYTNLCQLTIIYQPTSSNP